MNLAQWQHTMRVVLWEEKGWCRLNTARNWNAFLRENNHSALSDIGRETFALYESLLRNTVEETLSVFFPFCKRLLGSRWSDLAEQYRRTYPNRSYQLHQCARHFPGFIAQQAELSERYPFLPELALYEWLEVHVENLPRTEPPSDFTKDIPATPNSLLWRQAPVWNPDLDLRVWQFHIPRLIEWLRATENTGRKNGIALLQAGEALRSETHLLIYRDPDSGRARFFEINALTARLIELSRTEPIRYQAAFAKLKAEIPALVDIPLATLLEQGHSILEQCRRENILWGSIPARV